LFSYITLHPEGWQEHSYVALCGTGGQAMRWMLEQYSQLRTVWLGLDNDKAGQDAGERLQKEVQEAGYQCGILLPALKDWNDDLCAERELPAPVMVLK
jgi:DNA primase